MALFIGLGFVGSLNIRSPNLTLPYLHRFDQIEPNLALPLTKLNRANGTIYPALLIETCKINN